MVSLSPSLEAKRNYYNYLKTELLPRHLTQFTRRAFTMKPHNRSPGTTPHNTQSVLFHISWPENKIRYEAFSENLCLFVRIWGHPSFLPSMFHTSFKNSSNIASSKKPSKISLNRVCYMFYIYSISYYAKIYISKSLGILCALSHFFTHSTLRIHKRPETCMLVCPQYLCGIWHRSINKCLIIKLSSQCPEYTHTMSFTKK